MTSEAGAQGLFVWPSTVTAAGNAMSVLDFMAKVRQFDILIFQLDGRKMETDQALFEEFRSALDVGEYFHGNWDGLDEVVRDLTWVPTSAGFIVLIWHSEHVLRKEAGSRKILLSILESASRYWMEPIEARWANAHEPMLFRTVCISAGDSGSRSAWLAELPFVDIHSA
jgi:hypothetical protein